MADTQNTNVQEQDIHQLLKVKREKLANLQQAGKDPFQITKYDVTHHSTDIKNNFEELEGKTVRIAGRVMSKRVMGKASFCNVQDLPGNIQVYVARDSIGEESYADFKKYDVGDIVGIEGEVFKTKTGEISVHASQVILLSKSLQILPEKFHGLTNTDIRYRQRYTDLIMNQDVKDTFVKRSKIISAIRRYLDGQGFLEVETPMLVSNAGGAAARPFETHYNALDEDVKLRISLELYLKRLIVGGMERVFEIGRVFRNEGLDTRHNPEFTLMELYQAYTDYYGMMDLTENMFRYVAQEVCGTTVIPYAEETIDLGKPFERLTMVDAVKKYAGVDFDQIPDTAAAKKLADEKGVHYEERHAKGDILNLFFEEFVEEHLIQPVFIMDHPVEISPLTKRKPDKPDYVERFELFIYGREMCNAYSELNDPIDQRERFKAQEAALAAGDEEANTTDEDFMNALEIGMPPTGGIGYGIDRLVMLLTNSPAIRDVLLFPTMKSLDADKKSAKSENSTSTAAPEKEEVIDFSKVKVEPLFEEFVDFDTFSKSDFRAVKVKACEAVKKSKKLLQFTLDDGTGTDRTILSGIHAYYEPEELVGKTLIAITNLPPRAMMGIESCGMLLSAIHEEEGEEKLHLLMVDNHIPAGAKLY
ncbi:lysine--tRNA ligase [Simiaoa sp.]|uniref:lysine--tRNA ligase n=1 Tax=Simiaoa sp. TaxID=2944202 RepID=UPI003F8217C4